MDKIYTWDEINDPLIVSYKDRDKEIHKLRYETDINYKKSSDYWNIIRSKIIPKIRTREEIYNELLLELNFYEKKIKELKKSIKLIEDELATNTKNTDSQ